VFIRVSVGSIFQLLPVSCEPGETVTVNLLVLPGREAAYRLDERLSHSDSQSIAV